MRQVQEPTRIDGGKSSDGERYAHPAFGVVQVGRVSGYSTLFRSEFRHQHYITLTISGAELNRSLSNDDVYPGREVIKVAMSEAQFASMVSSHGIFCGTPCTIQHIRHETVPGLPDPVSKTDQFAAEATLRMSRAGEHINDAAKLLAESGLSKAKIAAIQSCMNQAKMDIGVNLNFVADQFGEHMERTVEAARAEINAHALRTMSMTQATDAPAIAGPIEMVMPQIKG